MRYNRKAIVNAILICSVLSYVLLESALYFAKVIRFDPNNIISIAIVTVPFVLLLIGAVVLLSGKLDMYINRAIIGDPVFSKFSKQLLSDLESLASNPYDVDGIKELSESIHEQHEKLRSGGAPIFCYPAFKLLFDGVLNRITHYGVLSNTDDGNAILYKDLLEGKLSRADVMFLYLGARLMIKNPMLSILYPRSVIASIMRLSEVSLDGYSKKELMNSAKKIVELLNIDVCGTANWKCLSDALFRRINGVIKCREDLLNRAVYDLCYENAGHAGAVYHLSSLLLVSHLKYYFVIDHDEGEKIRTCIKKACDMVDAWQKINPSIDCVVEDLEHSMSTFRPFTPEHYTFLLRDNFIIKTSPEPRTGINSVTYDTFLHQEESKLPTMKQ